MSARQISVSRITDDEPSTFDVTVRDDKSETRHIVSLTQKDFARLANGRDAEVLIEAAFHFLLDREAKEDIFERFDVSAISRYFPEFEKTVPSYLTAG